MVKKFIEKINDDLELFKYSFKKGNIYYNTEFLLESMKKYNGCVVKLDKQVLTFYITDRKNIILAIMDSIFLIQIPEIREYISKNIK